MAATGDMKSDSDERSSVDVICICFPIHSYRDSASNANSNAIFARYGTALMFIAVAVID